MLMCTTHRVLDRYKNAIGRMQHYWLVFACDKLGLTRYLLPSLTKKVSVRQLNFLLMPTLIEDLQLMISFCFCFCFFRAFLISNTVTAISAYKA